jgi:plasmid stabilization system protein ParE
MKIEVLEVARQEYVDALEYYQSKSPAVAAKFKDFLKSQVEKIRQHPDSWMLVRPRIRKCLGQAFPYDLIYEQTKTSIVILAIAHKKRKPNYWMGRIPPPSSPS